MKSPYSKVNTDRKHWLRRSTLSPITPRQGPSVISSNSKQFKDAQTNTLSKNLKQTKQNESKLNVTETEKENPTYNIVYFDSEIHWCNVCNVFPKTAKDYLNHLHTTRHKTLILVSCMHFCIYLKYFVNLLNLYYMMLAVLLPKSGLFRCDLVGVPLFRQRNIYFT